MKNLLIILSSIFIIQTAEASLYPSTFELSYKKSFMELQGNYFKKGIKIIPNHNSFQLGNYTPVDAFRNIYSSYLHKDFKWFSENTIGTSSLKKDNFTYYSRLIRNEKILLNGYAFFKHYSILFLKTSRSKQKIIFIVEETKDGFKANFNFKTQYPSVFKIINKSYKGHGLFKVIKEKR